MTISPHTPDNGVDSTISAARPEEQCLSSKVVYTGSFLKMKRDEVCLQNGLHATREYVEHPGAAMVIPLFAQGQRHGFVDNIQAHQQANAVPDAKQDPVRTALACHVLLERQYRYAVRQKVLEFPAGKLDPHETSLACAKRELREETGYSAARWYYLTRISPCISYSTEWIDLYLAQDLTLGPSQLDEGECLETLSIEAAELLECVKSAKISDVKTIIGAFWLEKILLGQWDKKPV